MEKHYHVLVSSTFEDLIDERLEVKEALLELDCIPCGMEYLPSANEGQWTFTKSLIDRCDYHIVIIAGCYGSEDQDGKSYTQKIYEYALSRGIPAIGFIYHDRNSLPEDKKEKDENKVQKLEEFKSFVRSQLSKDWSNAYELGAVVSRSLTQLIRNKPRTGWVRADKVRSGEMLEEIYNLRKERQELQTQISRMESIAEVNIDSKNIAFKENTLISGTHKMEVGQPSRAWSVKTSWKDIFKLMSPYLLQWYDEDSLQNQIALVLLKATGYGDPYEAKLDEDVLQSIKVQFLTLGLIQVTPLNTIGCKAGLCWSLTPKGKHIMLTIRSVKKK
jgi:hypothetical protein